MEIIGKQEKYVFMQQQRPSDLPMCSAGSFDGTLVLCVITLPYEHSIQTSICGDKLLQ